MPMKPQEPSEHRVPVRTIRDVAVALADGLVTPEWTSPPVIVGLASIDDEGFDLRVHPLTLPGESASEATHPAELLLVLDIPEDWLALGTVAYGWVAPLDDRQVRPSGHPDAERARIVEIMDRAGNETAVIQRVTGGQHVIEVAADCGYDDRETGAVQDALRRALGLPTPLCPTGPIEFLAIQWLGNAVATTAGGNRRQRRAAAGANLSWAKLKALHPAQRVIDTEGEPDLQQVGLVRAGELAANVWDWAYFRAEVAAGRCQWLHIDPDHAAWMDDPMFARTVLSMWPSLPDLRARLRKRLSPRTLERLDETLEAWGLAGSTDISNPEPDADGDADADSVVVHDRAGGRGSTEHRPGRRRQVEPQGLVGLDGGVAVDGHRDGGAGLAGRDGGHASGGDIVLTGETGPVGGGVAD